MTNLVLFRTEDYKVAAKCTDVLLTLNKNEGDPNKHIKKSLASKIGGISPLNNEYLDATQLIYFDGRDQLECIGVSDVTYIENFNEEEVVYFIENDNQDGIIGFINKKEEIIPIIDIPNFSTRWMKK